MTLTAVPAPTSPPLSARARRAIVGLGVTQILSWGSVYYAIGVTGPAIGASLGLSSTLVYAGFSLTLVVGALAAPFVGAAIDRIGGRRTMAAGALAAAAGLALMARAQGLAGYLVASAALGLAVAASLYDAAFAALAQVAGRGARRAITLLTLFGGFASTVFWPLTAWLSARWGWRETYAVYAAAQLCLCLPILLAVLADGARQDDFAARGGAAPAPEPDTLEGGARTAAFWLFAGALTANSFVFSGVSAHFATLFGSLGLSERAAVIAGMAIGPAQVLARFVEMGAQGRHDALVVGRASAALLPLGVGFALLAPFAPGAAFAFALAYGLANGLVSIAKGAVPLLLFGAQGYGATLGRLSLPSLAARAGAPTLFALELGALGARATLVLCLVVALSGMAAMEATARLARRARGR